MQANPFIGAALHGVGALSAASCYTPQKKTKAWSWEIYWVTQATFAWLLIPILGAFLTIPNYLDVLAASPRDAMLRSFLLGMLYGFGGLTFGLGIRYIGFSLNYAIAIGLSAGFGTLIPLIWHPNEGFIWILVEKFSTVPGWVVLTGIILSLVGIFCCGWAGAWRERTVSGKQSQFSFKIGIPLAVMAGILSSVFNFSLIAGEPLEQVAVANGASEWLRMNAIYPFSHGGAWVTNVIWCFFLIRRNKTASQLVQLPGATGKTLGFYYLMALFSGAMWYFQFFFYGMGHVNMGTQYGFTSWALHMAMLILFSNLYGKLFHEWVDADKSTRLLLNLGMGLIVIATLIITYGNYLGE
ncbi:rhamnose:proton symporter [bacterium]|nr:rhamnose:proton symporter [bacterium]